MRALRFPRFGDPSVLEVVDLPDPQADEKHAVVRVRAASLNPSDVKNVAGKMEGTTLPRVPGRDYSGEVIAGPREWVGAEVFGTGGDVGFERDGTHAELLRVPIAALVRKPTALTHEQAGSVGVTFVVAWLGAVEYAAVGPGESIAIFGVGGGVGGAVAQIAKVRGARVIGVDLEALSPDAPGARLLDGFVRSDDPNLVAAVRAASDGLGAQVVFDAVGGIMFEKALACLGHRGRLVEISATGKRRVDFDLADFYHNESQLFGADSRKLDLTASARILKAHVPAFERSDYKPPVVSQVFGLEDGRAAYEAAAKSGGGRVVIRPG